MPLIDSYGRVSAAVEVPVECTVCGATTVLRDLDAGQKRLLIEATRRFEDCWELDLLHRTSQLFNRHPLANHPFKLSTEVFLHEERDPVTYQRIPTPWQKTHYNERFLLDLERDPELFDHLSNDSFNLSARLEGISSIVAGYKTSPIPLFACTVCSDGHYILTKDICHRTSCLLAGRRRAALKRSESVQQGAAADPASTPGLRSDSRARPVAEP
jgi:hypothetical protein